MQRPELLTVRMFPCEPVEFRDDVDVLARIEPRLHQLLHDGKAEFLESGRLDLHGPLGELPERRPAPQGKCRFEGIGCASRVCPREHTGVDHTLLEIEAVEGVTIDADAVTRAIALQQGSDRLAKLRNVSLDGVSSRLGRIVPPQSVDDAVHRHDPVRLGQEAREHEPLLRPTERWLALGARSTAILRTCARGRSDRRRSASTRALRTASFHGRWTSRARWTRRWR